MLSKKVGCVLRNRLDVLRETLSHHGHNPSVNRVRTAYRKTRQSNRRVRSDKSRWCTCHMTEIRLGSAILRTDLRFPVISRRQTITNDSRFTAYSFTEGANITSVCRLKGPQSLAEWKEVRCRISSLAESLVVLCNSRPDRFPKHNIPSPVGVPG